MKLQALLLPLTALWARMACAQGNIPILNPLFNEDQLSCTAGELTCWVPGATGWLTGPQTGVEKVSTAQYPSAPSEGLNVMAIGYTNTTGSMMQTLGATVQANTTYVLKITLGARADVPFTGYVAALMAGNLMLASDNKVTPASGTFATNVIVYHSGTNPAQLGKPIQILVKISGQDRLTLPPCR